MHLLSAPSRSVRVPMAKTPPGRLWQVILSSEVVPLWGSASARRLVSNNTRGALKRKAVRRGTSSRTPQAFAAKKSTPLRFCSQAAQADAAGTSSSTTRSAGSSSSSVTADLESTAKHDLSWQAVKALFVASAVPMVGFGFMDNLVMIQAGQYIDSTLGVKLGLATMTAAACGQIVSDVSGVLFGGTLEAFINRWMPNPVAATLSTAQRQSTWGRYASLAGAVIGVTTGCAIGALTLFFVDLDARDRIQRAQQFKQVLSDMTHMSNAGVSFPCREVVVHLAVKAHQHYDWQSLNRDGDDDNDDDNGETTGSQGPHVRMQSLKLENEESADDLVIKAAHQNDVLVRGQRLFAPIMRWEADKSNEVWAVVEFEKDGDEVSESDIHKVELMSTHLAIFMHRMAD